MDRDGLEVLGPRGEECEEIRVLCINGVLPGGGKVDACVVGEEGGSVITGFFDRVGSEVLAGDRNDLSKRRRSANGVVSGLGGPYNDWIQSLMGGVALEGSVDDRAVSGRWAMNEGRDVTGGTTREGATSEGSVDDRTVL